ncbi:MAG TPA: class I SAM-dependent RNA methyltransferase [Gemmatimonadaceae bacterium]|nr:class I SAM-dependent RNA methyltransferase [Gemmatimonadaceae bacterium]
MSVPTAFDAFAIAAPGLEPVVAAELKALRARGTRVIEGGVEFPAGHELLYAANLHLRAASRVIIRLATFRATSFAELERRGRRVPWERIVPEAGRVRLRVTCRKSRLYHSDGVAERLLAGIEQRTGATLASATAAKTPIGRDPPDDDTGAGQLFIVRLERDQCTISADASGAHLHQRGYRTAVTEAPLRETLGAALVLAAGWDQKTPLVDPFCGSGTIPIEAALMARRIAPGKHRSFRFAEWPEFEPAIWDRVKARALETERPSAGVAVVGSDRGRWAMRVSAENAERAGVASDVEFRLAEVTEAIPPTGSPGWMVTNPPYGVRLGQREELRQLYADLGDVLRERFAGWHVGILSTDHRLDAQLRVPLLERLRTTNGGIRVHFLVGIVSGRPVSESPL